MKSNMKNETNFYQFLRISFILVYSIIIVPVFCSSNAGVSDSSSSWIEIERDSTILSIQPYFQNQKDDSIEIEYELKVDRKGSAGQASSTQSGHKIIPGHSKEQLSIVKVNFHEGDSCRISLKIFKDDQIIYNKVKEYPPKKNSN